MNLVTPTAFVGSLADKLDEITTTARSANLRADHGPKASSALSIVVRYVRDVQRAAKPTRHQRCDVKEHEEHPITDPRLYALWLTSGETNRYEPGASSRQARYLMTLAMDAGGYVDPAAVISQLATLAFTDRMTGLKQDEAAVAAERGQMASERASFAPAQEALTASQEHAQGLTARVSELEAQLASTASRLAEHERITYVMDQALGNGARAKPPAKPRPDRRTIVEGEVGVYTTASGRFEIGWKAGGVQRWEVAGDNLEEARAIREQRINEAAEAAVAA